MRPIKAFFLFWKDFLIGDCPEVALGVVLILGISFALHSHGAVAGVVVPVAVVGLLGVSVRRGAAKRRANGH